MGNNNRTLRLISLFTLLLIWVAFSSSIVIAFSLSEKSLERVSNQDGIKILVKYLPHEPDVIDKTTFQISLNTHYRDLSEYDLETSSFISIDDGPLLQAAEWTSTGDNHHVQGKMTFNVDQLKESRLIKLIIKGVGKSGDRVFEFKAPAER